MSTCVMLGGLFFAYRTGEHQGRKAIQFDFYNTGHIELEAKTLLEYCDKLNFNPQRMVEGPLHSVLSSAGVDNCGEDKFGLNRMESILNLFVEGGNHRRLLELAWVKSKDRKTRLLILFLYGGSGSGVCGLPDFRLYNVFNAEESFKRVEEFRWVDTHMDEIHPKRDACLKRLKEKRFKERFHFLFYDHSHELHFSKLRDGYGELSFVEYGSALKQNSKIKTYPFNLNGYKENVQYGSFYYEDRQKKESFHFLAGETKDGKFLVREYHWINGEWKFLGENVFPLKEESK
jgi:hypothetical protein